MIEQHFMTDPGGEHVVDFLQPGKLGLKVTHASLEAAHLRNHAGIWPANMAKQSLRHCLRSSTLSDQSGRARRNAGNGARLRASNDNHRPIPGAVRSSWRLGRSPALCENGPAGEITAR